MAEFPVFTVIKVLTEHINTRFSSYALLCTGIPSLSSSTALQIVLAGNTVTSGYWNAGPAKNTSVYISYHIDNRICRFIQVFTEEGRSQITVAAIS